MKFSNLRDFIEFDGTRTVHLIFLAGENPKSVSLLIVYKVDVTVNGKYQSEAFLKIILPPFQNTIRVSKYGNYMYFS